MLPPRLWGLCRAGDFARRLGFAASQGFRDDASIVPYEAQGKVLPGFTGYFRRKAAMHPFVCALRRIHLPLQGRLYREPAARKAPLQGAAESSAACGGYSETEQVQRSQNASVLQHTQRDAGTANR